MEILVTGGGGYLGSVLVETLLDAGHRVRVFDRFCFGKDHLEDLFRRDGCTPIPGDIRRLQEHPGLFDGVEAVAHLASISNDPSCDLDSEMTGDVNVESTRELAHLAARAGARRFLLASSCTVYGRGVFELLDEQSPANPVSTFARSKLDAELAALGLKGAHFEPVVARVATTFGWSPRMRFDLAVNQMVATAMRQGKVVVHGGGNQWRPVVHVRDAARALAAMLEAPADLVSGEIFNTGADVYNTRIMDLAQRVARHFPGIAIEVARDDDDLRTFRVQFAKIRERLDFRCNFSIDEGIEEVRRGLETSDIDPFSSNYFNVTRMKELLATPVDEGGEPVAARFIPLSKPFLGKEEEEAVLRALRSGWLTSGPQVAEFERTFAKTVEAPYALSLNSCTAALHLCLVDFGVQAGDEVITSPITWASTGNTLFWMGAKPVFVDVEPDTLNMDPALLEAAITPRTKAIMPVHIAGHSCDMDAIRAVAAKHGIPVVEDAAHALGAAYKDRPIGEGSAAACYSFYATKNITTMEGGVVATTDEDRAMRLRLLANNGMAVSAWDRYGRSAVAAPPEVATPGFKYALGNVGAAIGLEQLRKFDAFMAARRRLAQMYLAVLSDVEEIELPVERDYAKHAWYLFTIRLRLEKLTKTRNEIAYALRRENVGTGVHFYGLHLHRYYRETLGMKPEDLPVASAQSERILSLPLHPQLSDKNIHEVVSALKKVLRHAK